MRSLGGTKLLHFDKKNRSHKLLIFKSINISNNMYPPSSPERERVRCSPHLLLWHPTWFHINAALISAQLRLRLIIRRAPQSASALGQLNICSTGTPHDPTSMRLRFQLRVQLRSDCGSNLSSDLSSAPTPLPPHTREGFSLADPPRITGWSSVAKSGSPRGDNPRYIRQNLTSRARILETLLKSQLRSHPTPTPHA